MFVYGKNEILKLNKFLKSLKLGIEVNYNNYEELFLAFKKLNDIHLNSVENLIILNSFINNNNDNVEVERIKLLGEINKL